MRMGSNFNTLEVEGTRMCGILEDEDLMELVVDVWRVSNSFLAIRPVIGGLNSKVVSAYAPHSSLDEEVKKHFWEELDTVWGGILIVEKVFIDEILMDILGQLLVVLMMWMVALLLRLETSVEPCS